MIDDVQYIMVSNWDNYWSDRSLPRLSKEARTALFTYSMIKCVDLQTGPWPEKVETLFIELDKEDNKKIKKCWIGIACNFKQGKYRNGRCIQFEVLNLVEKEVKEEYNEYAIGWHTLSDELLTPEFFKHIHATTNWETFERYCSHLLRLLGLNDLYTIPRDDNRGKADGFFKFCSLAVVYDATLVHEFEEKKEAQIDNYIGKLNADFVKVQKREFTVKGMNKQIWIITRGDKVNEIKTRDSIKVKEIPIKRLIDAYFYRLKMGVDTEEFCDYLLHLK